MWQALSGGLYLTAILWRNHECHAPHAPAVCRPRTRPSIRTVSSFSQGQINDACRVMLCKVSHETRFFIWILMWHHKVSVMWWRASLI